MLSEAEYLELQASRAKARFRQTASTLGNELLAPFELRPFIQRCPWWSLGGAAAAGFVSGASLGHRGRKAGAGRASGKLHELFAMVHRRVRRVLGSALGAMVVANLRGGAPAPPAPVTNGRGPVPASKAP